MISSDVMVDAVAQASSQVRHPVGAVLAGVAIMLFGLPMVIKPRLVARLPRWQFKNVERVEPSDFSIDLMRISGVVWMLVGLVFVVAAFVA